MFTVELLDGDDWKLAGGDYFLRTDGAGGAIAAASRGYKNDGKPRRVVTYPGAVEVWRVGDAKPRKQKPVRST